MSTLSIKNHHWMRLLKDKLSLEWRIMIKNYQKIFQIISKKHFDQVKSKMATIAFRKHHLINNTIKNLQIQYSRTHSIQMKIIKFPQILNKYYLIKIIMTKLISKCSWRTNKKQYIQMKSLMLLNLKMEPKKHLISIFLMI